MISVVLVGLTEFIAEALLFDLDGVLVDSTAAVTAVWHQWANRHGLDATAILAVAHGRRSADVIADVLPGPMSPAESQFFERLEFAALDLVVAVAGARAFLTSLRDVGWMVVTSGTRTAAQAKLRTLGFDVPALIAAEDVRHGKPDPEPYLLGAAALGVDPARCIVFEDAPAGIESAKRAGSRVIAVATTFPHDTLGAADAVIADFRNLRFEERAGRIRFLI